MKPQGFEELLAREPLLPFRIFLTDGNQFDVTRRTSIAVGRNQLFIVRPDERWTFIPIGHVASVETLQPA